MNNNFKQIRYWDENLNSMIYVDNARLIKRGNDSAYVYTNANNEDVWISLKKAMRKTGYDYSIINQPIYERDVVLYKGIPHLVFADSESRKFVIFDENDKIIPLSEVFSMLEIYINVFDGRDDELVQQAIKQYEENISKNNLRAILRVYNARNYQNVEIGSVHVLTEDNKSVFRRGKFENPPFGYGTLWAILEGLKEIRLNESDANHITIKIQNDFCINILNNPSIIKSWVKNGGVSKEGKPIANLELWKEIYKFIQKQGFLIKAEKITAQELEIMKKKTFEN